MSFRGHISEEEDTNTLGMKLFEWRTVTKGALAFKLLSRTTTTMIRNNSLPHLQTLAAEHSNGAI
jgi:hypothetical protein